MTAKHATALTFHHVRMQCEKPDAESWRALLYWYSPLVVHLLGVYRGDPSAWEQALAGLGRGDFARLKEMARQSEREFLVDLRRDVFETMRSQIGERASGTTGAPLDLERMTKTLAGLPLLHQEILWFKLAGYTDATIEAMMRVSPKVAQASLDRFDPDLAAARELAQDHCFWPDRWPELLHEARAAKKEDCPPLRQLLRIQDGQVSWYDKEPMERRVAGCAHCLENWTALREVGYWRRKRLPARCNRESIERLLKQITG